MATDLTTQLQPGAALPKLDKGVLTQEQFNIFMDVYGRRGLNPIHSDKEYAQRRGFQDTLAPGVMAVGWLNELLSRAAGGRHLRGGNLTVNFIGPMYPGNQIFATGQVREHENVEGGRRAILDIWCEDETGRKVVAGTAVVPLA